MSGGSFAYLCHKSPPEVLSERDNLMEMLTICGQAGQGASPGARAIWSLIMKIDDAVILAGRLLESDLLHDIEWYASSDYSKEQAISAMQSYPERSKETHGGTN